MLEQGITIVKEKKSVYGTVSYGEAVTILYFRNVLKFLGPEDLRDEIEKDVWELKNLDIKIRSNPIYNVKHWISEKYISQISGKNVMKA